MLNSGLTSEGLGTQGEFNGRHALAKITHVVVHILSTNVDKRVRQVAVHHLEAVVQCPEGDAKHVTDALETTAGGRVRLKHDERLSDLLCQSSVHQVIADGVHADSMRKVVGEDRLRVLRVSGAVAFLEAIVVWVSERRRA